MTSIKFWSQAGKSSKPGTHTWNEEIRLTVFLLGKKVQPFVVRVSRPNIEDKLEVGIPVPRLTCSPFLETRSPHLKMVNKLMPIIKTAKNIGCGSKNSSTHSKTYPYPKVI